MRVWCGAIVFALSVMSPAELLAQGPPPSTPGQPRDAAGPAQKTGTARLSGRVTSLDTGRPIRRAVIRAMGPELREGKSVSTDADGRWELRDMPAGRFTFAVTKGGYVPLSYGQQRPFETGKTIDVAEAQVIEKLDVALPRGGAVTGRIVDEFGEAVSGANVSPLRFRYVNGQRQLSTVGVGDTSDDLGQYRLHGLPPGEYYISARPPLFTYLGTSEDRTGYGQTFHPGVLNVGEASRLTVGVGQEAQNVLIALSPSRIARLSGTVTSSAGTPVRQGIVMIRGAGNQALMNVRPGMIVDGAWTIHGVTPGDYQIVAQYADLERIAMSGGTTGMGSPELAVEHVTVTGDDIVNITLVTAAGGTARGTVRFEGEGAPAAPSMSSVFAFEPDASGLPMTASGRIRPDWTFEIKGVLGRRLFRVSGLPAGWTMKSVSANGTDVTDAGIEVKGGQEVSDIEILMTRRVAELSGAVHDAKGTAVSDFAVVVFSPEPDRWGYQSRYVRVARPDQTGRFLISGLPPGSYLAVALEYLESGEETNPEFLARLKDLGTSVRIADAEKKTLTLTLSRP